MGTTGRREPTRAGPSREVLALRGLHRVITAVNAAQDLDVLLDTVTRGVVDVLGFGMAVADVLDPDGWLTALSVAGDESARETMSGRRVPFSDYAEEFELAVEWGLLKFVPHDNLPPDFVSTWVPTIQPLDHPDAWHPLDALHAPLRGPDGSLVGVLGVDLPEDGMRPGPLKRQVLEMYAVQAGLAIHQAQERQLLRERLELSQATRQVIEAASRDLDLDHLLRDSRPPLLAAFDCDLLWLRMLDESPADATAAAPDDGLTPTARSAMDRMAHRLWRDKVAWSASATTPDPEGGDPGVPDDADGAALLDLLRSDERDTILVAPLGVGSTCLGTIVMQRDAGRQRWSEAEREAALTVGQELGRAVAKARLYARERALVAELQELDRYKGELIGTITHELKTPLTAIRGHVELLEDEGVAPRSVDTIRRNVDRLQNLAEDLLVLASVRDPQRPFQPVEVDLSAVLQEVCDDMAASARQRDVRLEATIKPGAMVCGEQEELRRLAVNLVSNAVKYCRPADRVEVSLERADGGLVLRCSDTGIGIAETDLPTLFEEFDRSSNPTARAESGSGLGLAIVQRIVDRHGARVDVASRLGAGTTFTVTFPA